MHRRYLGGGLRWLTMLLMDGGVGRLTIRMMDGGLRPLLRLMALVGGRIILQQLLTMTIKRTYRTLPLAGEVVGVVVGEKDAGDVGEVENAEDVENVIVPTVLVVVEVDITLTHREERIVGRTKSLARITRITRPGRASF